MGDWRRVLGYQFHESKLSVMWVNCHHSCVIVAFGIIVVAAVMIIAVGMYVVKWVISARG